VPGITYFDGFDQEGSERETGSIESEGDLRGGSVVSRSETVISGILGFFTCIHVFSLFCLNVTFLCKLRRIMFIVRIGIHACTIPTIGSTFGRIYVTLLILVEMVF